MNLPVRKRFPFRRAGPWFVAAAALLGSAPVLRADAVDDLIAVEAAKRNLPGVSVAIVRDGRVIKTAAHGLADLERAVAVTPDTVFQIQSITKTFTATAILLMAEEGRLFLDDPVGKHLEGTPESWRGITLRHLLSHTSGIKDFINEPTASLRLDVTEEEVLRATAPRPLNFQPGERYAYSNTNYHLLAMILRKLEDKAYAEVLRERIFVPLGMTRTRVVSHSEIIPGRAAGYSWTGSGHRNGGFVAESILAYGGGGILSTGPDMALWARAVLDGKVLRPESWAAAWAPARLNDGSVTGYGLGWGVTKLEGHREVGHTGGHITGFTSGLVVYPEDRLAVVVLQNCSGKDAAGLARRIAGLYVPEVAPRPATAIPDSEPTTAALLRDLIGQAADWRFEESRFTPDLWKVLVSRKEAIQAEARALGKLRSLDLLSRTWSDGIGTSRYRATFAERSVVFVLAMDRDGRVQVLNGADE